MNINEHLGGQDFVVVANKILRKQYESMETKSTYYRLGVYFIKGFYLFNTLVILNTYN